MDFDGFLWTSIDSIVDFGGLESTRSTLTVDRK